MRDERVYRYSGLGYFDYQHGFPDQLDRRKLTERTVADPFPPRRIASPLYLDYSSFASIPKPNEYRAFFVLRDPRDVVVSWYFSMKRTHGLMGRVPTWRAELERLPKKEGLRYAIRAIADDIDGFEAMRSWVDAPSRDPNVLLVRFEDLVSPAGYESFGRLFEHCDIRVPSKVFRQLITDHSFEKLTGRRPGDEDRDSHLRKGLPGDWTHHLDDEVLTYFESMTGDLVSRLGYA